MMELESQHHPAIGQLPAQNRQALSSLALDTVLPSTPSQYAAKLIEERWGSAPLAARLVDLNYDFYGYPAQQGVQQGRVRKSQSLVQALLSNYQTVGAGRFGETAFGLYTPPAVGPQVRIVEIDQSINPDGGFRDYEGIYRQTIPQLYGPSTQLKLQPAEFKQWVWELEFKDKYTAYVHAAWPSDEVCLEPQGYPLRTSVKTAFVMAAYLQHQENSLTRDGLTLALRAAGFDAQQAWEQLTAEQWQAWATIESSIEASRLVIYRYVSSDIWSFREKASERILLYIPGNSSPFHEFSDHKALHRWVVEVGRDIARKEALAAHFSDDDRQDGTFHAGVLTALDGMAIYPRQHHLKKGHGFFNDDGYWDPADYVYFEVSSTPTDPFAQWVLVMKQAAQASIEIIRDDAQVNRDDLSAVVEPVVQWINKFGPLALFVPGGEGLLALAGLIDAGYGLAQAVDGKTPDERSEGITRIVFGLLNALPLVAAGAAIKTEEHVAVAGSEPDLVSVVTEEPSPGERPFVTRDVAPPAPSADRAALMRGIGPSVQAFSDEVLTQIAHVSAVDDDVLRLIHVGQRAPSPLLADTISRFRIDQDLEHALATSNSDTALAKRAELFNSRYQALQHSEHEWVRLFQQQYPGLPKSVVEQMLDRYGVDFMVPPDVVEAANVFKRLDSKARQYQQHVRLNRAYEGLYLRTRVNPESDTLALHSLERLPGWPKGLRIEVLDRSISGRVVDRCGPFDAPDCRRLIKTGDRYRRFDASVQSGEGTDFYDALLGLLSEAERSALPLQSVEQASELRLSLADRALSRSELMLGLDRMDSGLPFEAGGLRGGGFPVTLQGEALTHEAMRLQVKELYPDFSDAQADELLQRAGAGAQTHLDGLRLQALQLHTDLTRWINQAVHDADDMDIDFLAVGDVEAEGLNPMQVAAHNVGLLEHVVQYERETRAELADELIAIWQKRPPDANHLYSGEAFAGFKLDLEFEDYHRLPALNVRFNEVIELSMRGLHLVEHESLNGFIECFPNLRTLSLEGVDLRLPNADGELESVLPPVIPQLSHLTTLNLKATFLAFRENSASQLSELVNLQTLDLSDNPLGVSPVVLGMKELRQLNLRNTRITTCPIGIMDPPYLTSLDLRDNRITRVSQAVLNQAVARDRVKLWGNPLTDEDTLLRLVSHRESTGINLWLSAPGPDYGSAVVWLREGEEGPRQARQLIWQRLAARPSGTRFLRVMDGLSLTADFQVNYLELQARVWQLLREVDESDELWGWLSQYVETAAVDAENPFTTFTMLEDRARLHRDWVSMGRPFPIGTEQAL
ncbi:dermonecrotic toxin domain-containing protein [Pseudomonas sp. 6D_7.1_Bac1]|uniref:dermonecrotic toxin domain-containing protein n=1 Tax=Pseudomonas sp. 6D_7.1_Bac1 TaxID=2971615 RepID=UPI0021C75492|nr:DUF6543 domain-containing protein [Pseudomonas sp. 6D_7.1_Bac1]MCU1752094.1 hypothetical protein [Pseudomonas sp. 6D_7.1_Bac1]